MGNISPPAGEIIVDAENLIAFRGKSITEMRPKKTGATGNQYSFCGIISAHGVP
jgi:hypothetical protein